MGGSEFIASARIDYSQVVAKQQKHMHTQNWVLLYSACFKIEILLLSPLNIIRSYHGGRGKNWYLVVTWLVWLTTRLQGSSLLLFRSTGSAGTCPCVPLLFLILCISGYMGGKWKTTTDARLHSSSSGLALTRSSQPLTPFLFLRLYFWGWVVVPLDAKRGCHIPWNWSCM